MARDAQRGKGSGPRRTVTTEMTTRNWRVGANLYHTCDADDGEGLGYRLLGKIFYPEWGDISRE